MNQFKKILIMGLPGSGKTTLASKIVPELNAAWLNADTIRKQYNDWDFSEVGRIRQAIRMNDLANKYVKERHCVVDFICPTPETRKAFQYDILVFVDTIYKGRFEDTNNIFIRPEKYDLWVTSKNADFWKDKVIELVKKQ